MTTYLYILHCADGTFYTGVTNDLFRRVSDHIEGTVPHTYTFSRRPVKLVYYEKFKNEETAFARQNEMRHWSVEQITQLINGIMIA